MAAAVPAAPPARASGPSIEWATSIGADGPVQITHIVADGTGVIVAGTAHGVINGQVGMGSSDAFVAAINANGSLLWVRQFGTASGDSVEGLAGDATSLYVVGRTSASFDTGQALERPSAFIARLSRAGSLLWVKNYEREWWAYFHAVATGPNGSAIVIGEANDRTPEYRGYFVRRYSSTGSVVWTQKVSGRLHAVASDDGGFTVGGALKYAPTAYRGNPWVARYNFAGAQQWSRFVTDGINPDNGEPMELNGQIDVLASGSSGVLAGGSGNIPPSGLPAGSSSTKFARLFNYDGSPGWTTGAWVASASAECSGFLIAAVFQGSDEYFGGRALGIGASGNERWRFEQRGSSSGGEWAYHGIVRAGSRVFVLREHRQYDPTGAGYSVAALRDVPDPVGCGFSTPTVTSPQPAIAPVGVTASYAGAPMELRWSGSGGRPGTVRYQVRRSINGGAWTTVATGLTQSALIRRLKPGRNYRFGVRAVDGDGRTSAWADGPSFFVGARQERSTAVTYSAPWGEDAASVYFGGYMRFSRQSGAWAGTTVNTGAIGWVTSTGPHYGAARVFVNGTYVETVDLYSPTVRHRVLVFSKSWASAASRSIRIEVSQPPQSGRALVELDAFVFWR
ncbi:MAG TPA: fibronectin type III domain-containing protein [Candidatus Limnocylindrales bacterium]|nr:fibronectin type III domain-containing protein [Candidatus Limnocylindrales bacterium]